MNRLNEIVAKTRSEVERRRRETPVEAMAESPSERRPFLDALRGPGLSLIAEHKRASPSAGPIREDLPLEEVVSAYERGGAAALSVLTDGPSFGGSLDDLRRAREVSGLPILRKDFVVDPYQMHESLAIGADAILLIVAALDPPELERLHRLARELGLTALVEVHDRPELERARDIGAELIGINNRDLPTLGVDPRRTFELLGHVPDRATVVAESGYRRPEQLEELAQAGVDAVLIGEALMRSIDVEAACRELTSR